VKLLSIGFLIRPEQAVVWRGPMVSSALRQFINECDWGELDYFLIDLPPGTGDIHLTLLQIVPLSGVVMVTTPQPVALADAYKAATMLTMTPVKVPVLGVVENMSWFTPAELPSNKYYIFGNGGGTNMANELGVPLLGQIPVVQSIREHGDTGTPAAMQDGEVANVFKEIASKVAQRISVLSSLQEAAQ
jgi:ATP-binding protein involved in chromosome partitioning